VATNPRSASLCTYWQLKIKSRALPLLRIKTYRLKYPERLQVNFHYVLGKAISCWQLTKTLPV
jgi:hypothetical protein